jgi:peptidoglycan hydrolase CwlO-like protein
MQAPKFREDLAALVDKTMHGFVQKIWRYLSAVAGVISILLTYIFLQTSANLTNLSASVVRLGNEISSLGAIVQSVEKQADKNQAKTERLEERIYSRGTR